MNIKESISQLVGNTPLLELKNIQKEVDIRDSQKTNIGDKIFRAPYGIYFMPHCEMA